MTESTPCAGSGLPFHFFIRSRSFLPLFWFIYALGFATPALAQVVSVTLAEVTYSGNWEGTNNDTHRYSKEVGDSILYQFQGSGISYISALNPKGGLATITVDGESAQVDESVNITDSSTPTLKVLYTKSGLDPTQIHTFQLVVGGNGQFGGPFTEFYGLTVDMGVKGTNSTAIPSGSPSAGALNSAARHSNDMATIVGGILGAFIVGILVAGAGVYLLRRRRLATAATNQQRFSEVESKAYPFDAPGFYGSSNALPIRPNSIISPATEQPPSSVYFPNPYGPSTAPSSTTTTVAATPAVSRGKAPAPLVVLSPSGTTTVDGPQSPMSGEAGARSMASGSGTSQDPPPSYPETPAPLRRALPHAPGIAGPYARDIKSAPDAEPAL